VSSLSCRKQIISGGSKTQREIASRALILISGFIFLLGPAVASADLFADKAQIESLIQSGNLTEAHSQIEKLKSDYAQNSQLPCALYWIGRRYEWSNRTDEAKTVYQQVMRDYSGNEYAAKCSLSLARQNVLSLIISGEYDSARDAVDKLLTDFANEPALPETLYWVARRYGWSDRYEEEKNLYQKIIQDYPNDSFAYKARLGFARANVLSFILSQKFDQADATIDELTADFADHPDLPDALYWIAEGYRWAHRWEDAKDLYQKVVKNYPNSSAAGGARIGLAKVEVLALIAADNYAGAKKELHKLITTFVTNPDLPETLYWIAREYEWIGMYEDANGVYEQILRKYPDGAFADKARLGTAAMTVRLLIVSGQIEASRTALQDLKNKFAGHSELPATLRMIARSYEGADTYELASDVYQQTIETSPDGASENSTQLDIARMKVCSLIASEQFQPALSALSCLIADFNDHPDLAKTVLTIGAEYAEMADEYERQGDSAKAIDYSRRAIKVWEKIITDLPASADLTPEAYYLTAARLHKLNEFDKAIECCQTIIDTWPDYKYIGHVRYMKDRCLMALGNSIAGN
jgi:tetratricopeptide (TPR) repeat protein